MEEQEKEMLEYVRKKLRKYSEAPKELQKCEPMFEVLRPTGEGYSIGEGIEQLTIGEANEKTANELIRYRLAQLNELSTIMEKLEIIGDCNIKNKVDLKIRLAYSDAYHMIREKCENLRAIIRATIGQSLGYEDRKRLIKKQFEEIEKWLEE